MAHSQTSAKRQPTPAQARRKVAAEKSGIGAAARRRGTRPDKCRLRARLLVTHPDIDPAEIIKRLGIEPKQSSRRGDPRTTPAGSALPGTYRDSRWSISFPNLENIAISELVTKVVESLPAETSFWSELARDGGNAELILGVVGTRYQGESLDAAIVRKIADMGMRFGLEIYACRRTVDQGKMRAIETSRRSARLDHG